MTKSAGKRRSIVRRGNSGSSQQLTALQVNASERSIAIDVSRLAPPQNIYDADCAGVEHRRGDVRLFFGKLKLPRRDQLRSRIEIRYPVETFYKHLWQNSRGFHERLRQYAQQWSSDYGHDQLIWVRLFFVGGPERVHGVLRPAWQELLDSSKAW